ncbi:centrosomal protein of 44 kda [Anaeramoeba flamelloides]|uniref:Centrosomal protein of 44 kDa n=1 Tax=Anaeramoeba flamelloides TaxID=1746091 RepID=A0AAV7Z693_9EUKA|nr:centrosomal protein of 44 kda [Anaeramoeba flamelloides]
MSATKPKKRRISELSSSRIIEILQHELKNVKFPTEINSEKLLGGDPKIFFQIFKHLVFSVSDVLTNFFVKRGSFNTKSSVHFLRQLFLVGEKEFGLTPPFTLSEFLTDKFSHEKAKYTARLIWRCRRVHNEIVTSKRHSFTNFKFSDEKEKKSDNSTFYRRSTTPNFKPKKNIRRDEKEKEKDSNQTKNTNTNRINEKIDEKLKHKSKERERERGSESGRGNGRGREREKEIQRGKLRGGGGRKENEKGKRKGNEKQLINKENKKIKFGFEKNPYQKPKLKRSGFDPLSQTTVIPTSEFKKTYGVRKTSPIKTNSSSNSSNSTSVNFKKNVRFKQNNLIDEGEDDVGYDNGNENKNKNGKQNEDEDDFYYNPNSEKNGEYQNKYNYQKTKKVGWESPIISHVEEFSNTSMSASGSEYGEVTEMMFQTSFDRLEKWLKSQFELIDLKIEKSSEKIHNSIERIDKRVSKLDREVKQLKSQLCSDGNGQNTTTKGILKNSNYGHRSMYLNINNGMNSDNFLTNSPKSKRNSKNNYQNY